MTDLITRSDDERLRELKSHNTFGNMYDFTNAAESARLLGESLCAALIAKEEAERFLMDVQAGCDITRNGVLYRQVRVVIGPGQTADFIRAEAAERKVCAMREAIRSVLSGFVERCDKEYGALFGITPDQVADLEAALTSSAPCVHKSEAGGDLALIRCPVCGSESATSNEMTINKELHALRAAVEWIAKIMLDEKHWGEVSNADLVAELRRIAGGGR
jgi:hypothetical protein